MTMFTAKGKDKSPQPTLKEGLQGRKAIKRSMQIYSLNSDNVCMKNFKENALHFPLEETLYFSMIRPGCIQQESRREKYWIYAGLP